MKNVCCVGIAVADVVAKTVSQIPEPGKLELIDGISMHTGGCAVNAAVDLAKLGIDTSICSLVGEDAFGDFIQASLGSEGVKTEGIKRTGAAATSSSIVLSLEGGERSFLHNIGANGVFNLNTIDWDVIEASDVIFVAGALLMPRFDGEETALFLKRAKEMGKTTVLDTAWDSTGAWMKKIEPCLPYVDYFVPSIEEAKMLSGEKEPSAIAAVFLEKGCSNVIIKMGEKGCYARIHDALIEVPVYKVNVVDTNGAGDSFVAGFIAALVEGLKAEEALRFACAVGAHCVGALGASTGIVHKDQIYNFIEENKIA